jgi:ATP-dependent DNA helicase RecQ
MADLGTVLSAGKQKKRAASGRPLTPDEEELFQKLRELRKGLADDQRVPAYIVFSDKVLMEMAIRRPRSDAELLAVPGVGPAKLEKYGSDFLEAVNA